MEWRLVYGKTVPVTVDVTHSNVCLDFLKNSLTISISSMMSPLNASIRSRPGSVDRKIRREEPRKWRGDTKKPIAWNVEVLSRLNHWINYRLRPLTKELRKWKCLRTNAYYLFTSKPNLTFVESLDINFTRRIMLRVGLVLLNSSRSVND